MITIIKGYTRKSVLLEKLVAGTLVGSDKKLVVDLVGVPNLCSRTDVNVIYYNQDKPDNIEALNELYQEIVNEMPEVTTLFICGNFKLESKEAIIEISRPFANHFDITLTVQMEKDFGNRFEIEEIHDSFGV